MNRVYRWLLVLAPRELRDRHRVAMQELFAERLTAAFPRPFPFPHPDRLVYI